MAHQPESASDIAIINHEVLQLEPSGSFAFEVSSAYPAWLKICTIYVIKCRLPVPLGDIVQPRLTGGSLARFLLNFMAHAERVRNVQRS